MYWGKYVAHDNNRDGMGQFLALTRNVTKTFLEWKPTVLHDLHEQSTYLYASTGTGPYNEAIDPITIDEWWLLAKTEVMEMTKRGVPGVWTYGFYDGWTPNYMFFIAHSHNAIGRFYEVMGYGPENRTVTAAATTTSREWFRPNPPLPSIQWGPRNNTNIQQSAILIALNHVAKNKDTYLENYWLKNKRALAKGTTGPTFGWVIPASQKRKAEAADAVNELRRQGLEVHTATAAFKAGSVDVKAGDYVIRGDQPYRTLADMYFSVQSFSPSNPRPYDDTGWTFQYMRNIVVKPITDKADFGQLAMLTTDAKAPGGIEGSGPVLIVEHTTDNNLVTFRFKHKTVAMQAAQDDFEAGGRKFRAGAFIIPNADRARARADAEVAGLVRMGGGVGADRQDARPRRAPDRVHPQLGEHAERGLGAGCVRHVWRALHVLRGRHPASGQSAPEVQRHRLSARRWQRAVAGERASADRDRAAALPEDGATPNLGALDQADDIRGGMGWEGLMELVKFVQQGGTLITEGSTATIFPEYNITNGVTVESPEGLFVRGSVMRGVFADRRSPSPMASTRRCPSTSTRIRC